MDARTYLEKHGDERCKALAEAAGTKLGYFKQIAYGHRRPSVDLAKALVTNDPKRELDLVSLLDPPARPAGDGTPQASQGAQ